MFFFNVSEGVVDYVSDEGVSAVDRSLALAEEISVNGQFSSTDPQLTWLIAIKLSAPLALRAAKQAISRAPELALESG
jgi:methylglutaconyl-CoA hydratase